jgi:thymidylate kinase
MFASAALPGERVQPTSAYTVELAGIPGAGKTTLCRHVEELLETAGMAVARPLAAIGPDQPVHLRLGRKAIRVGYVSVSAPVMTARITSALARSGQPGIKELVARVAQVQVTQQALLRAASSPVLTLLDEGMLQSLWSAGLRGQRLKPMLQVMRSAPSRSFPDMVVVVNTPPQVALSRLSARGSRHSRTQTLSPDAQLAELVRGSSLLEELVDWCRAEWEPRCVVMEINGSASTRNSALSIVRRVLSRPGPGQAPAPE